MRYREFALEALKPSEYRPLVKGWDKTKYANLFGGKYRIYIPLETATPTNEIIKVNPRIKQEVEDAGYKIEDYLKGIAVKTENGRTRQIKIGKLLSPETAKIFVNDPVRGATRQSNQLVVISRHPYDIAGMSTDRGWTSCMNLREPGNNKRFVPLDIKAGTIIAYIINANDRNIENPKARTLIKPFVNILGNHEVALGIEDTYVKYGTAPPEFIKTVSDWVDKVNASNQLTGMFQLDLSLYPDNNNTQKFVGTDKEAWLNKLDASEQMKILRRDPSLFQYIKNPPESLQLLAVEETPSLIRYINNPSETVQLKAVKTGGSVINFIIDKGIKPSEIVQREAVTNYGRAIRDIIKAGIKPSEAVQEAAVTQNGDTISYIIDSGITPSESVQVAAVGSNSRESAIIHIVRAGINPSETVLVAAVTEGGGMIRDIVGLGIKPSERVLQASVSKHGRVIKQIIDVGIIPSEDVQTIAVGSSNRAIEDIIDAGITPSERVQQASVEANGHTIEYIIRAGIKPSETVLVAAVTEAGHMIEYIVKARINPSETVQIAAVTSSSRGIQYIMNAGIKPSEPVQIAAVSAHKNGLDFIIFRGIKPSETVQIAAVTKYPEHAMDVITRAGITLSPAVKRAAGVQ